MKYNTTKSKLTKIGIKTDSNNNRIDNLEKLHLKDTIHSLHKKVYILSTSWTLSSSTSLNKTYTLPMKVIPHTITVIPIANIEYFYNYNKDFLEDFSYEYYILSDKNQTTRINIKANLSASKKEAINGQLRIKLLVYLTTKESYYEN